MRFLFAAVATGLTSSVTSGMVKAVPLFLLSFRECSVFSLGHTQNDEPDSYTISAHLQCEQNSLVRPGRRSPADVFGVVLDVVAEVSDLILGDAFQPINDQLQHGGAGQRNTNCSASRLLAPGPFIPL